MDDWKEARKRKYAEVDLTQDDDISKPACKYGENCYRKNPDHLRDFHHSETSVSTSSSTSKKNEKIDPKFFFTTINDVPNAKEINKHNSISLASILSRDADQFVKSAQFNYMFDYDWFIKQFPNENRKKPIMFIDGGDNRFPSESHIKVVSAKFDNIYGKHHSKMMFLLYNNGMRVVIHTANIIEIDWYQKTNGVWISELFPPITDTESKASTNMKKTDSVTNFKQYLIMYLEHYQKKELNEWIDIVKTHDMKSANVFLVASVPGRFSATKRIYGMLRMQKLLEDFCIPNANDDDKKDNLIFQFSSIGSLGPNENAWLCGEFKSCLSSCKKENKIQVNPPICVYPTIENVLKSYEGLMAGGSLPYSDTTHEKQKYLENFLYKWKADSISRTRCMPHIKSFARYSNDYKKLYWFLLTSANLSKAAWGKLEKKETQIFIMSYEIGVLFFPTFVSSNNEKKYFDLSEKNDFIVPYDLPPTKYASPKDKPWVI